MPPPPTIDQAPTIREDLKSAWCNKKNKSSVHVVSAMFAAGINGGVMAALSRSLAWWVRGPFGAVIFVAAFFPLYLVLVRVDRWDRARRDHGVR